MKTWSPFSGLQWQRDADTRAPCKEICLLLGCPSLLPLVPMPVGGIGFRCRCRRRRPALITLPLVAFENPEEPHLQPIKRRCVTRSEGQAPQVPFQMVHPCDLAGVLAPLRVLVLRRPRRLLHAGWRPPTATWRTGGEDVARSHQLSPKTMVTPRPC